MGLEIVSNTFITNNKKSFCYYSQITEGLAGVCFGEESCNYFIVF
jgi:hypothetical protein